MSKLTLIQNELKAPKGQTNKFGGYKYRSCEDIMEAVKPLLAKHDCHLTVSDEVKQIANIPQLINGSVLTAAMAYVEATATLFDGNSVVATVEAQAGIDVNKKGMDTAQCFGSASSYARKYALNGLFAIDDTKDSDATNDYGKGAPAKKPAAKKEAPPKDDKPGPYDNKYGLKIKGFEDALKKRNITLKDKEKEFGVPRFEWNQQHRRLLILTMIECDLKAHGEDLDPWKVKFMKPELGDWTVDEVNEVSAHVESLNNG